MNRLLAAVALGLAVTASGPAAAAPPAFQDPPFLESKGGELEMTLESVAAAIEYKKNRFAVANTFNGVYIPPVLRLQQGDALRVHQVNHLTNLPVNLHSHGARDVPARERGQRLRDGRSQRDVRDGDSDPAHSLERACTGITRTSTRT